MSGRGGAQEVSTMVLRTRGAPLDDSPVPGVIPATIHIVHGEPPEADKDGDRRRRKAARRPLIARARAVWAGRRTDRR
jgi:hypothetical protein